MSQIRRSIALILIVVLVVALTAACTTPGTTATTKGTTTGTTKAGWTYKMGGPVSEKPVTVKYLTHSGHSVSQAVANNSLPTYAQAMKTMGITVDWQILQRETYNDAVNVRLMSSDLPDMVVLLDQPTADKMVEDKAFIAYDDLDFINNAPYLQVLVKQDQYKELPSIWRSLYADRKIYSFGGYGVERGWGVNTMLNTKWISKLGMKEPATLDEFTALLKAFRDKDPNGNSKADEVALAKTGELQTALGYAFELNFTADAFEVGQDGKLIYEYVTDKYFDYLTYRKMLFDENLIDKEKRDMTAYYELIAQDRLGGVGYWATFQRILSQKDKTYKTGELIFKQIVPLATKYSGKRQMYSRLLSQVGEGTYILKSSKNAEVCLRVNDYFYASDEWDMMRNFGILGLSYDMDASGKITPKQPKDWDPTKGIYVISLGGGQPPFANRQSEKAWFVTYYEYLDRLAEVKPTFVDGLRQFVFNSIENAELKKYKADVTTYRDEMAANFIEGRQPLTKENFAAYVKKLNEIGQTAITKVFQDHYNAIKK